MIQRQKKTAYGIYISCQAVDYTLILVDRKFPPSKEDAISPGSRAEVQVSVQWPSPAVQDHLLSVYFTYVHPFYPIIHKYSFLALYNAR